MRRRWRVRREAMSGSLRRDEERGLPVNLTRRRLGERLADDASDIISSSLSDEKLPAAMGSVGGKKNVGSVGMETGSDGLEDRLDRLGNVGEIGEDCGVLRRKNVEMGVLAMRSASNASFCGRFGPLVSPTAEERRPTLRVGDRPGGDDDSICAV